MLIKSGVPFLIPEGCKEHVEQERRRLRLIAKVIGLIKDKVLDRFDVSSYRDELVPEIMTRLNVSEGVAASLYYEAADTIPFESDIKRWSI